MGRRWSKRYHPNAKHRKWCIRTLVKRDGARCALCKEEFARMGDITLDHIIARSDGGGDEIENLQLAHDPCNLEKDRMTTEDWVEFQTGKTVLAQSA
jgi:5-methylcytosine-specific restriction endonuclease McrA